MPSTTGEHAMDDDDLEQRAINVIRGLAMDMPQAANSGHPGTAMALAPLAHVLWTRVMRYDADAPALARPRPLRALGRPRVGAAVLDAPPHRLRPDARRPQGVPPVGLGARPGHPEVHHTAGRRGHHRPARPGRRPTASAWASPSGGCGPASAPRSATTTRSSSAPTATSRRASATRPPRWPATSASAASSTSTTTTTSRSTAPPSWRCPTTPAKRFEAYGWHVDGPRRGRQRPRRARGGACAGPWPSRTRRR